jgi:16S rRNA processing protein RimM
MSQLVLLGSCRKPHGLKGEAEFHTPSGSDTHLDEGSLIVARMAGKPDRELVVEKVRRGNNVLIKFEGIADRTALEALLPFEVWCDRDAFPDLEEGELYVVDLIGLKAIDEDGTEIGKLEDFYETPAQVVFRVRLKDGTSVELPFIANFFPGYDLEEGTITVVLPEVVE